jgi:hypothetical protein
MKPWKERAKWVFSSCFSTIHSTFRNVNAHGIRMFAGSTPYAWNKRPMSVRGADCEQRKFSISRLGQLLGWLQWESYLELTNIAASEIQMPHIDWLGAHWKRSILLFWLFALFLQIFRRPRIGGNRLLDMRTQPQKLTRRCEVTAILVLYGLPRLVNFICKYLIQILQLFDILWRAHHLCHIDIAGY